MILEVLRTHPVLPSIATIRHRIFSLLCRSHLGLRRLWWHQLRLPPEIMHLLLSRHYLRLSACLEILLWSIVSYPSYNRCVLEMNRWLTDLLQLPQADVLFSLHHQQYLSQQQLVTCLWCLCRHWGMFLDSLHLSMWPYLSGYYFRRSRIMLCCISACSWRKSV